MQVLAAADLAHIHVNDLHSGDFVGVVRLDGLVSNVRLRVEGLAWRAM